MSSTYVINLMLWMQFINSSSDVAVYLFCTYSTQLNKSCLKLSQKWNGKIAIMNLYYSILIVIEYLRKLVFILIMLLILKAIWSSNWTIKPKTTAGLISFIDFRTPNFVLRMVRCTTNKLRVHWINQNKAPSNFIP